MGMEGGEGVVEPWLPAELLRLLCSPACPHPAACICWRGRVLLLPNCSVPCNSVLCPCVFGDYLHWGIPRLVLAQKWVVFGECIRLKDGLCASPDKKCNRFYIFELILLAWLC